MLRDCVPQHATQGCVLTPMAALTTRIRRCGTSPDFAPETEVTAHQPIAPCPRRPPQAILRSLKSHSWITASVANASDLLQTALSKPPRPKKPDSILPRLPGRSR